MVVGFEKAAANVDRAHARGARSHGDGIGDDLRRSADIDHTIAIRTDLQDIRIEVASENIVGAGAAAAGSDRHPLIGFRHRAGRLIHGTDTAVLADIEPVGHGERGVGVAEIQRAIADTAASSDSTLADVTFVSSGHRDRIGSSDIEDTAGTVAPDDEASPSADGEGAARDIGGSRGRPGVTVVVNADVELIINRDRAAGHVQRAVAAFMPEADPVAAIDRATVQIDRAHSRTRAGVAVADPDEIGGRKRGGGVDV